MHMAWRPYRAQYLTSHSRAVLDAVLSAIGRRNVPVPAASELTRNRSYGMSYGPREVGARVGYDAMGRPVQFRSDSAFWTASIYTRTLRSFDT